jgi:nucleoside-diphosphate-sugar epimerase
MKIILVTGSSGFIGGHLVKYLQSKGNYVIGADIEYPKYEKPNLFYKADLRNQQATKMIFQEAYDNQPIEEVYDLACLMGGMGYIGDKSHSYDVMVGSTQIVANIIECCVNYKVKKTFYSSSACVYNMYKQETTDNVSLKEEYAYPAMPDLVYGWQKLQSEIMYQSANQQHGLDIRIARFHNIFGEQGTWDGGKEKYPAAICRKVAQAKDGDTISIWGDGLQTRSFLHITDCITGIMKLMDSNCTESLNIGSDELVSINDVAEMVIKISGKKIKIEHDLTKPQGVRGRNSENTKILEKLGWKPESKFIDGITKTYNWVNKQTNKKQNINDYKILN